MPGANPKIEELRKLFLPQSRAAAQIPDTIFASSSQPALEQLHSKQPEAGGQRESVGSAAIAVAKRPLTAESTTQRSVSDSGKKIGIDDIASGGNLGQAIDKLFEPARVCNDFFAQVVDTSNYFRQLSDKALRVFESLENFRDHMRKLSSSFASIRNLQNDLGIIAESFDSVRALQLEVTRLTDAVGTRLAEVARSLDPASTLRTNAAELVQILEHATELQAQFYDLSKRFESGP